MSESEKTTSGAGAAQPSLGGLMKGKRAVVTGVANDRSLAWGIAEAFHREGAQQIAES